MVSGYTGFLLVYLDGFYYWLILNLKEDDIFLNLEHEVFDYNRLYEGDNFFKSASYTIEAICADSHLEAAVKLKDVEAQILSKRNELHQFETEYHEV